LYGDKRQFLESPGDKRVLLIRAKNVAPEGGLRLDRNYGIARFPLRLSRRNQCRAEKCSDEERGQAEPEEECVFASHDWGGPL